MIQSLFLNEVNVMQEKIKNIRYLFKILWDEDKKLFIILLFDIIITTLAKYPFIIFPKYILDALVDGKDFNHAVLLIVTMICSELILSLLRNVVSRVQREHSKRLEFQLHTNVTNKTLSMSYEKLLDANTYDSMYLASDIANGNNFMNLMENIKNLFSNIILLISMIYIISQVDILLMVLTFIVVIINSVTDSKIQNQLLKTKKETSKTIRELEYIGKLAWHIDYAKEVRLFDTKELIYNKYYILNEQVLHKIFRDYKIENKGKMINNIAGSLQTVVLYLILGLKLLKQIISIGDFTLYMNAVNSFKGALNGLLHNVIGIEMHSKYFSAYMDYIESENCLNVESKSPLTNMTDGFYFENVYYRYPGQKGYALEGITVSIKKGEKISLVGENGAGKTTFILLLLKMITPTSGCIFYNGCNINDIEDSEYWKIFSTVFQDYKIYNFSVAENILLNDKSLDKEKLESILKKCGMYDEISNLSNGVNTTVGHEFSNDGVDFSGGQRQRLAIARSIYKNGEIMILDEPTAALDAKAEYEVFQLMRSLAKTNTAIFISHRLYSAKFCDQIFFFYNGKIAEKGTHEELMKMQGKYFEMFNIQAQYYEGGINNETKSI